MLIESKDTSTATTTASEASPVQQLVESSVTAYTRPPETQPSLTTAEAVTAASSTSDSSVSTISPTTSTSDSSVSTISPTTSTNTADTRPHLVVGNLLIDATNGTATALSSLPSLGLGGGGLGGGVPEPSSQGVKTKKSWLPIILMVAGIIVILKKSKK